jgi:hypothetical protein
MSYWHIRSICCLSMKEDQIIIEYLWKIRKVFRSTSKPVEAASFFLVWLLAVSLHTKFRRDKAIYQKHNIHWWNILQSHFLTLTLSKYMQYGPYYYGRDTYVLYIIICMYRYFKITLNFAVCGHMVIQFRWNICRHFIIHFHQKFPAKPISLTF